MDLRRLYVVVRRRLVLLVVVVIAGLLAAYLGTSRANVYVAEASLYVGQSATNLSPTTEAAEAVLAQTFSLIIPTTTIVSAAIKSAGVSRTVTSVVKNTRAAAAAGTNLIGITVRDRDPLVAKELADAVAEVFVVDSKALAPLTGSATGLSANKAPASVAQLASVPAAPLSTNLSRNVALGGLAGLLVAAALVLLLDFLGLSARTPSQLETQMDMPVIGIIPFQPRLAQARPTAPGANPDLLLLEVDDG